MRSLLSLLLILLVAAAISSFSVGQPTKGLDIYVNGPASSFKITAQGSFTVTNTTNSFSKTYQARS